MKQFLILSIFFSGCGTSMATHYDRLDHQVSSESKHLALWWLQTDGGDDIVLINHRGEEFYVKCGVLKYQYGFQVLVDQFESGLIDYSVCQHCEYEFKYNKDCTEFTRDRHIERTGQIKVFREGARAEEVICVLYKLISTTCR